MGGPGSGGHNRKSTETKRAEGTMRSRDKTKTALLIGGRGIPEPRLLLTEGQRELYDSLCEEFAEVIDLADRGLLELIAIEESKAILCMSILHGDDPKGTPTDKQTHGLVIMGAMGGPIINPANTALDKALGRLATLYDRMGSGPQARARIADLGITGKTPAQALPGVGAKPTPLRAVANE